jgi:hypothetical protein
VAISWPIECQDLFMSANVNDIIVFQHFDNAIEANIAKTKLDAYGVPCFLTEEHMAALYPGSTLNAFKIRLHLFAADRERAAGILNLNVVPQTETSTACPRCHSDRISRDFPRELADRFKFIFFGVFFPDRKVNHCLDCDLEF